MIDLINRLAQVPELSRGSHRNLEQGCCAMEAASYVAGEPWSASPDCVCPVIAAMLRTWNDDVSGDNRYRDRLLRRLILPILNTRRGPETELRRILLAADWLIRQHTPTWLRLAGYGEHAGVLSALPEITSKDQGASLEPVIKAIYDDMPTGTPMWEITDIVWSDTAGNAASLSERAFFFGKRCDVRVLALQVSMHCGDAGIGNSALLTARDELQQSAVDLVHRMIAVGNDSAPVEAE